MILIYLYFSFSNNYKKQKIIINYNNGKLDKNKVNKVNEINDLFNLNSYSNSISNNEDVLLNPYTPPLKNDMYNTNINHLKGMPINIATQGYEGNYRQIGILTRINGEETMLPLLGRPLITNRDKWQYYCMNDKNNAIKLPISSNGKSCTSEYGCDSLYNGDTVYVEGYNDAFKVTMYENNTMRYIPHL
jgi:hypothetical protein